MYMSLKKLFFTGVALAYVFIPTVTGAINLGVDRAKNAAVQAGYSGATNETTLAENIGAAVRVVLSLTGIIFTGLMVYAGFLWMTAKGDESKVEKAQEIIKAAIIGWVVTIGAYSITDFVVPAILSRLGGN